MKLNEIFNKAGTKLSLKDVRDTKELAKKLNVQVADLAQYSDEELLTLLKNLGYNDFSDSSKFDKNEIAKGIKVEREHTKSNLVARLIALDHLSELPDYYTRLEKMENEK